MIDRDYSDVVVEAICREFGVRERALRDGRFRARPVSVARSLAVALLREGGTSYEAIGRALGRVGKPFNHVSMMLAYARSRQWLEEDAAFRATADRVRRFVERACGAGRSGSNDRVNQAGEAGVDVVDGRRHMPNERLGTTCKITFRYYAAGAGGKQHVREADVYVTVGRFADGTPGEVFVRGLKEGGLTRGWMDAWAKAVSIAVQRGEPLVVMARRFRHWRFGTPVWIVNPWDGGRARPVASILDAVCAWIEWRFGEKSKEQGKE